MEMRYPSGRSGWLSSAFPSPRRPALKLVGVDHQPPALEAPADQLLVPKRAVAFGQSGDIGLPLGFRAARRATVFEPSFLFLAQRAQQLLESGHMLFSSH
jgi:hypothetical protein